MPNKGKIPKKVEDSKNHCNSKTRQRKQHGSIQIPSNKLAQHWRKSARETPH